MHYPLLTVKQRAGTLLPVMEKITLSVHKIQTPTIVLTSQNKTQTVVLETLQPIL